MGHPAEEIPLFHEVQGFRAWLQAAVLAPAFVVGPLFGWALYQQLVLKRPFGNQPMEDRQLIVAAVVAITVTLVIAWLFFFAQLKTTVYRDRVVIRFRPFHVRGRVFAMDDIVTAEAREYRPILEYGGWGIRYGLSGMAYNVSGNRGVQLSLRDGRRVLIGSQRAEELEASIAPFVAGRASIG
ncbi:MAG: DUF6141 family protein [Thermoanaerobaculia bacterium]